MLGGAENRVHDYYRENNDRALDIAREHRNYRRRNQNQYEQIRELTEENLQNGFLLALCEYVFAVPFEPFSRLLGA